MTSDAFGPYGATPVIPSTTLQRKKCIGNSFDNYICYLGITLPNFIDVSIINNITSIKQGTPLCLLTIYGFSVVMTYHGINTQFTTSLPNSNKHVTSIKTLPTIITFKVSQFSTENGETFPPIKISLSNRQTQTIREYTGNKGTVIKITIIYKISKRLDYNILTNIWKIISIDMDF